MNFISIFIRITFLVGSLLAITVGGIAQYRLLLMKRKANSKNKKHDASLNDKEWRKKKKIYCFIIGTGFIFLMPSLIFVSQLFFEKDDTPQIESNETDVERNQYTNILSAEFGELRPNDRKTKWENILDSNLGADQYGGDKSSSDYEISNGNILVSQDKLPIAEEIHALYENNAGYVIEPEYSLSEINQIIANAEDKKDIDVEFHKQEVILYAGDIFGRENSISRESICQAGRAAHDVVNCLCQDSETDVREIIFYAALAKKYYDFAIGMPINEMKSVNRYDEYVLYRMGMLFDKLAGVEKLKDYREHFLLEAASFYALASETGEGREGMSDNHIFNVDFFRGRVLYYLYNLGREDEKECAIECIENFLDVKDRIPEEFRLSGVEISCEHILKRLKG
ncbi:MAG: hypothetical protein K1W26_09365 [Acetatifactor sp.]